MKIYTKKGDEGQTGLLGGERVSKDHLRIRSYGTLDELNACLGLALAHLGAHGSRTQGLVENLLRIQGELFQLGAELATPRGKTNPTVQLGYAELARLEKEIDGWDAKLAPLKSFILPGGSIAASQLHLARTVSRRAERELVVLHRAEPLRPEVLRYANRLSDYLFVAARLANHLAGGADVPWLAP